MKKYVGVDICYPMIFCVLIDNSYGAHGLSIFVRLLLQVLIPDGIFGLHVNC